MKALSSALKIIYYFGFVKLRNIFYTIYMYPGEFETLFRKIINSITLEMFAKDMKLEGSFPKRSPATPTWDAVEAFVDCEYIDIGGGKLVSNKIFSKVRIPFFMLLAEFESRLFRIHEWNGKEINELNEKNLNELIVELLDSDLIKLQREYPDRKEFREDMKAVSSFRNIIMHVNKKLEKTINIQTIIERKKQINKILSALQQILDKMERKA